MADTEAYEDVPPHHSRPDLFGLIDVHDQTTELLPTGEITTQIVGAVPLEDLSEVWHVGYRLDDRYEIQEIRGGQGSSGMGIVYVVKDDRGRMSAVKTLQRRFRKNLFLLQRFIREARTWMLVGSHPNVVRAEKLEIIEAAPCLFMELVPSDARGNHSVAHRLADGPMSVGEALDTALQCCAGMVHATLAVPGLVHRDLKPENMLITPGDTVKVTDFGLVRTRAMDDDSLEQWAQSSLFEDYSNDITRVGTVFGTPAYMAPEQFTRADTVDTRADIYALGCCLYEMLTGAPPFVVAGGSALSRLSEMRRKHLSETPVSLRSVLGHEFPAALEAIVMRCLKKNPRDRWASAEALSVALLELMGSLGLSPREQPVSTPSAAEVAAQMRSITLLEGYDQAIHMRRLREGQEDCPYAFHLALASYFHCAEDPAEEERQLSKALALRGASAGYEAVNRLASLWIRQGHAARADTVLRAYLSRHPDTMEQLLEPAVRVACAFERFDEALQLLEPFPTNFRVLLLRCEIMRARGDAQERMALLREIKASVLADIARKLAGLRAGATVGWSRPGDRAALEIVVKALAPEVSTSPLDSVRHAVWPDIGGYPDFAPDLAWLSFALGELADLQEGREQNPEVDLAGVLGYPDRLEKHLERDEYWFWMRETQMKKQDGALWK